MYKDDIFFRSAKSYLYYSNDMIFIKDTNLTYIGASMSFIKFVGLNSEEELVGKTDFELFTKEFALKYTGDDKEVLLTGKPMIENLELIPSDDSEVRYSITSKYPIFDEKGAVIGIYGVGKDITAQHKAEVAAINIHGMLDNIPGGIAIFRVGKRISCDFMNGDIENVFGYTKQQYLNLYSKNIIEHVFEEDRLKVQSKIEKAAQNKSDFIVEFRIKKLDGTTPWIKVNGKYNHSVGSESIYYTSFVDISERKKVEFEMSKVTNEFKDLFHNLPGGFVVHSYNKTLYLELISEGFCKLLGKKQDELIRLFRDIPTYGIHANDIDKTMHIVSKALSLKKDYTCIYRMLCGDGKYHYLRSTSHLKIDKLGNIKVYSNIIDITETMEAEEELAFRNSISQLLIEDTDTVVFDFDVDKNVLDLSYLDSENNRKRVLIKSFFDILPNSKLIEKPFRKKLIKGILDASKKETEGKFEYQGSYTGKVQWYRATYKSVVGSSGEVYRVIGKASNIQDEKDLEQRFNEEIVRRTLSENNIKEAYYCDLKEKKLIDYDVNKDTTLIDMFDSSKSLDEIDESIKKYVFDDLQRNNIIDFLNYNNLIEQYKKGYRVVTVEYRALSSDGKVKWCKTEANLLEQPSTKKPMAFIFTYDINDQKISELFIKGVVEAEFDYVFQVSAEDKFYVSYKQTEGNDGFLPHFGSNFENDFLELIEKFVIPEDRHICLELVPLSRVVKRLDEEGDFEIYYRINKPNMSEQRKKMHVFYSDKETKLICIIRTDITRMYIEEQRRNDRLRNALLQAEEASKAKSNFLSNVSHDIRTPMNIIIGMSSIASSHINDSQRVKDCLNKISVSSKHLLSLINDVLDLSKVESGKMTLNEEEVNLAELIHELMIIIHPQIRAADLKLSIDINDIIHENIIVDKLRITQIFLNIVGNSCKFTNPGGTVSIKISELPSLDNDRGLFKFVFSDTGIGMEESFIKFIFEPFERERTSTISKKEGSGLGMAITKRIIDLMGGKITVESEVDVGTTFTVTLDLRFQENKSHYGEIKELVGLRSLVVDYDHNVCTNITQILKVMGMRSDWTTSGREALLHVKEASENNDPYNAIILDLLIPDINGIEVAREIRKTVSNNIPIVILTAYDWTDIKDEAIEAGITAFLSKPLFRSDLYRVLRDVYDNKKQEKKKIIKNVIDLSTKRVLLVEDSELNMEIVSEIIGLTKVMLDKAWDGLEALEKVKTSPIGYYDLILCDIQMPKMNGYETAKRIRLLNREDTKTIPIIALTANAFKEDIDEAIASGMNGHISKPVDPENIINTLKTYLS